MIGYVVPASSSTKQVVVPGTPATVAGLLNRLIGSIECERIVASSTDRGGLTSYRTLIEGDVHYAVRCADRAPKRLCERGDLTIRDDAKIGAELRLIGDVPVVDDAPVTGCFRRKEMCAVRHVL